MNRNSTRNSISSREHNLPAQAHTMAYANPGRPVALATRSAFRTLAGASALLLALTLLAPAAARGQSPDFSWRGALPAGQSIEVKGVNGAIRAVSVSGNEVEVTASKSARRSNPDEVTVEVVTHKDGVTICAVYPGPRGRQNECLPGSAGRMETRNNDVDVEFTVHVPRGVHFVGRTVNGDVEALSLLSDVRIRTVNGGIRLTTIGQASATTVNGSIAASIGRTDWEGAIQFKTVNGGITLDLPAAIAAEFDANTTNGSISSDFPIQVLGRISPRQLRGTIGEGGEARRLEVRTVNGSIKLRKSTMPST